MTGLQAATQLFVAIAFTTGIFALLLLRVVTTTIVWSDVEAGYREFRVADYHAVCKVPQMRRIGDTRLKRY